MNIGRFAFRENAAQVCEEKKVLGGRMNVVYIPPFSGPVI
jgi:hypothetical protein